MYIFILYYIRLDNMNTLEGLKERLMIKPTIDKQKQFTVAIIERTSEKR